MNELPPGYIEIKTIRCVACGAETPSDRPPAHFENCPAAWEPVQEHRSDYGFYTFDH